MSAINTSPGMGRHRGVFGFGRATLKSPVLIEPAKPTRTQWISVFLGMSMTAATPETLALREILDAHRDEFLALLTRYAATNPRLFGSMARGTAHEDSDIDILVEMHPADGNILMRASGLMEETRVLFGRDDIDIFPVQLLKQSQSRHSKTRLRCEPQLRAAHR